MKGRKKRKVDSLFEKRVDKMFPIFYPATSDRAIILHVKDEMNKRNFKTSSLVWRQNG